MSARLLKRIVCFHSDVDLGVTTHLESLGLGVRDPVLAAAAAGGAVARLGQVGDRVGRQVQDGRGGSSRRDDQLLHLHERSGVVLHLPQGMRQHTTIS